METNEVDLELQAAQEALRRAQQRKADAEEAARLAAQAALTKNLADEQERLHAFGEKQKRLQGAGQRSVLLKRLHGVLKRLPKLLKPSDSKLSLKRDKKLRELRQDGKKNSARCKRLHGRWKLTLHTLKPLCDKQTHHTKSRSQLL